MKAKSPAFQFYPKDWLSDGPVREMTHEQKGIYADLLSIYWIEEGLPSDLGRLARLTGVPARRFEKLWEPIGRCFRIEGDRLVQKRLEEEKAKQDAFRKMQSVKGSKGGKPSAVNTDSKPGLSRGEAQPKPESSFPFPSPSSFPSPSPEVGTEAPALPPADRTERAIKASTDALRGRLYALVSEAVEVDPRKRDPTELMRLFTSYDRQPGRNGEGGGSVRGVVNAALLSHERLERSIADAEGQLAEWRNGTRPEQQRA